MTPSNSSDLNRSRLEYLATSFHPTTYSKATAVARKEVAYDSDRSSPSIIVLDEPPQSGKRRRDSSKSRVETPPAGFQANRGRLTLPGGSGGPSEGRLTASRVEPMNVIIDSSDVVITDTYAAVLMNLSEDHRCGCRLWATSKEVPSRYRKPTNQLAAEFGLQARTACPDASGRRIRVRQMGQKIDSGCKGAGRNFDQNSDRYHHRFRLVGRRVAYPDIRGQGGKRPRLRAFWRFKSAAQMEGRSPKIHY